METRLNCCAKVLVECSWNRRTITDWKLLREEKSAAGAGGAAPYHIGFQASAQVVSKVTFLFWNAGKSMLSHPFLDEANVIRLENQLWEVHRSQPELSTLDSHDWEMA